MLGIMAVLMLVASAAAAARGEATASASSPRGRWTDLDALANVMPSQGTPRGGQEQEIDARRCYMCIK